MLASRTSGVDAVRLLIEHGAKVNVVERWQGETPLMYAAANDRGEVAAALIAAGADVNARTPLNDLPERKPAVRYFVEIPSAGLTPVMFAARHGAVSALRALIKAGADIDAKTPEGFSPVVIALDNLHFDAAKVLVEAGASADGGGLFAVVEARNRVNYVGEYPGPDRRRELPRVARVDAVSWRRPHGPLAGAAARSRSRDSCRRRRRSRTWR